MKSAYYLALSCFAYWLGLPVTSAIAAGFSLACLIHSGESEERR